jgi:hypothetical protein
VRNFAVAPGNSDNCLSIKAKDVGASEIDGYFFGFNATHSFSFFHSLLDRVDRGIGIHNHTLAEPAGFRLPDAYDVEQPALTRFTGNTRDPARSYIEADRVLGALRHLALLLN